MSAPTLAEWLTVMLRLRETNREAYEQLKAEAWECIARAHGEKTPEQLDAWKAGAS